MEIAVKDARTYRARPRSTSLKRGALCGAVAELPAKQSVSDSETSCCGEPLRPFRADDGRYISVCMRCGKETTHKHMAHFGGSPWIGVDLDGTLARDGFDSQNPETIGAPVEPMMERVRQWLADGQTVKIFTARASVPRQVDLVKQWLNDNGLPDLEVTNAKDFKMIELWDDRAVQVSRNSGQPASTPTTTTSGSDSTVKFVARRKPRDSFSFVSRLRMFFAL